MLLIGKNKQTFLPSQKRTVVYSGSGEEVTVVELVATPAHVTDDIEDRERIFWWCPGGELLLFLLNYWVFSAVFPEASGVAASGRKPLAVRSPHRHSAGLRMERLLLYSWQALKRRWRWSCGARWVSYKYGGEGNRGGDGGDDGDNDDLLSSKCYICVCNSPIKLYTFLEYWYLRSLKWK